VSRYQKKHSPTHHPDHHPIFISFFHLPRSTATFLFKLRAWQSFCTTSFHVLFSVPLGWSGALHLIFHTFLHPISVFFSQHMPIPSQPVLLCINTISSIPSLSLNSLLGTMSFTLTLHIHLPLNIIVKRSICSHNSVSLSAITFVSPVEMAKRAVKLFTYGQPHCTSYGKILTSKPRLLATYISNTS